MKIDSNTSIEEVKQKTKDSLNQLCDVKNNEKKSENFIRQFMNKLNNDEIKKDTCPQMDEFKLTDESIKDELNKYKKILESGISDVKDCRTCENMSCRVEQNEKPVDDCLGYINKKLVKTIDRK